MHKLITPAVATAIITASCATLASAHDGRRFDIQIIDSQLWAQGYLSGAAPTNDGGGLVRPYLNAIHGHWSNNPSPAIDAAAADLPGFDLFSGGALTGHELTLSLIGASKWIAPPLDENGRVVEGTVPDLVDLDAGDDVFVTFDGETVSTSALGTLTLSDSVSAGGELDIDLSYDIADRPENVLYVLRFEMATTAPGVLASDPIHVILSPDGTGPVERLHFAALHLERHLGTVIPNPGVMVTLAAGGLVAARRHRGTPVAPTE